MKIILTAFVVAIALFANHAIAATFEGMTCGTKPHSIDCSKPGSNCENFWTNGYISWTTSGKCKDTSAEGIDTGCNCQ